MCVCVCVEAGWDALRFCLFQNLVYVCIVSVCVCEFLCVCVCVYVRKRERERDLLPQGTLKVSDDTVDGALICISKTFSLSLLPYA